MPTIVPAYSMDHPVCHAQSNTRMGTQRKLPICRRHNRTKKTLLDLELDWVNEITMGGRARKPDTLIWVQSAGTEPPQQDYHQVKRRVGEGSRDVGHLLAWDRQQCWAHGL